MCLTVLRLLAVSLDPSLITSFWFPNFCYIIMAILVGLVEREVQSGTYDACMTRHDAAAIFE
jgi:hypothetical protein